MMWPSLFAVLSFVLPLVAAVNAPAYSGWTLRWQSVFPYARGVLPDYQNDKWNVITGYLGINNETQVYTRNPANLQCSGQGTLQITPVRDARGGWTSGRIESRYTFLPTAGRVTLAESRIRFGTNPTNRKQGIWPAFWVLGDILRRGGSWPSCGELDILENINGQLRGYGTAHCGPTASGGPCRETTGLGGSTPMPDMGWHTWRITWDRRPASWRDEAITWYLDGRQFFQIRGSTINNQAIWSTLCRSNLYFIVNMAVGGFWVSGLSFPPDSHSRPRTNTLFSPVRPIVKPLVVLDP